MRNFSYCSMAKMRFGIGLLSRSTLACREKWEGLEVSGEVPHSKHHTVSNTQGINSPVHTFIESSNYQLGSKDQGRRDFKLKYKQLAVVANTFQRPWFSLPRAHTDPGQCFTSALLHSTGYKLSGPEAICELPLPAHDLLERQLWQLCHARSPYSTLLSEPHSQASWCIPA